MNAIPSSPRPPADRALRRILTFFVAIAVVLVAVVAVAVRNINRSELSADWVNHTHAVILEVDGVLASVHAGDGALRTYVMTGDARDQAVGREAFAGMVEHLEIAKALTRGEPEQHAQVLRLEMLATQRADLAQRVFTARQSDRAEAGRTLVTADANNTTMSEIQRAVEKLKAEEMALLAERDRASYLQAQTTRWTVWSGVALDVALLGGVAWVIREDLRIRRRAAAALEEANLQLEARVRDRTAELSAANSQLTAENLEQRWAHQASEHQLRYHQMIFNAINSPVLVVTKALNISRVNPAVVRTSGLEPAVLIDQPLANLVKLPELPTAQFDALALALREGRELRGQPAVLLAAQGRQIAVQLTLFPMRDRDKVVGGIVVLEIVSPSLPRPS